MRELVYYVAVGLDGRIAGRDGDFSAFPVVGDHMETITTEFADALPAPALRALGRTAPGDRFDTVLMGWNTYAVGLPLGVDSPYPHLRQIVFSRTPGRRVGDDVEVTSADPVEVVDQLRTGSGAAIWLCGGGTLAGALADRIDRLILKVNPIILGAGVPVVSDARSSSWQLVGNRVFESGVMINEYVRP